MALGGCSADVCACVRVRVCDQWEHERRVSPLRSAERRWSRTSMGQTRGVGLFAPSCSCTVSSRLHFETVSSLVCPQASRVAQSSRSLMEALQRLPLVLIVKQTPCEALGRPWLLPTAPVLSHPAPSLLTTKVTATRVFSAGWMQQAFSHRGASTPADKSLS